MQLCSHSLQSTTADRGSLFSDTRLYSRAHSAVMFAFTSEQTFSACDYKAFTYNLGLKFPERQAMLETLS